MAELFHSLSAGPFVLCTFIQYSNAFYSGLEAANDVLSGYFLRLIVPDNGVKLRVPRLTVSEKVDSKPSHAAFSTFFRDNFRPEVTSDVISSSALEWVTTNVHVKFIDSMSNRS